MDYIRPLYNLLCRGQDYFFVNSKHKKTVIGQRLKFVIKNKLLKITVCLIPLLLTACASKQEEQKHAYFAKGLKDTETIAQNTDFYLPKNSGALLISTSESKKQSAKLKRIFFSPWSLKNASKGDLTYFKNFLANIYTHRSYAKNNNTWSRTEFKNLIDNANYKNAPSLVQNAIITQNTSLRIAPTTQSYFTRLKRQGESYAFDMFQNSFLNFGSPVKVFHQTKDKEWFYVQSYVAGGWVKASDLAFVDEQFVNRWKQSELVAITKDKHKINQGKVNIFARLGTLLPLIKEKNNNYVIAVPYSDKNSANTIEYELDKQYGGILPIKFNSENMARLADQLIGNPYGWGGISEHRDCSSTLQDLFTPFGIFLPRNSKGQGNEGQVFSLAGLSSSQKEAEILRRAIPFRSLIYLPGHIGLYVGKYQNMPVMFHNMWGIRLQNDARFVIGKTVITSLSPGSELKNFISPLIERVKSFNILAK